MQASVPELMELAGESAATHALYGTDSTYVPTSIFARECLLARRMVERGVRFIELTCPVIAGHDRWDQHTGLLKGHGDNALAVDQPIAGLLKDLKSTFKTLAVNGLTRSTESSNKRLLISD